MKRLLALGMAMALTVSSLAGCGGSKEPAADGAPSEAPTAEAEEPEASGGKLRRKFKGYLGH